MNTIRELPIGIQDFEKLRRGNYVYVDKTQFVYETGHKDRPYFLGRPRRFGKSLFLSTLKAYFEGKKDLFKGLKIAKLEKEWIKYPVIHIDFNRDSYPNIEFFNQSLDTNLNIHEEKWGRNENETTPASRLIGLIHRAYEKTGRKVVVLIDEYDKPLISSMDSAALNDEIRNLLKGFYGVLKAEDAYLRFVFLTGVTKFSKVSVFSDLNHLIDISLSERFTEICGISESELLQNFKPEINALAARRKMTFNETFAELKKRYDGYHFAKISEDIYNPFSVLNTFAEMDFANYWFKTGTPTFLVKALKNQNYDIRRFENDVYISANSIMDYRVEDQNLIPLLYQSGYLTVKKYEREEDAFVLGFPNEEVKYGFLNELLPAYVLSPITTGSFSTIEFSRQIKKGDIEGFMTSLKAFFVSIPYNAIKKKHRDEQYYQHVFYLLFTLLGQFTQTEVRNNKGRADAVVKTLDNIYVFEFKMDDSATAEDALQQINSKDYTIPYITDHRKVTKIGVEFSQKEKGIKRWLIEK